MVNPPSTHLATNFFQEFTTGCFHPQIISDQITVNLSKKMLTDITCHLRKLITLIW